MKLKIKIICLCLAAVFMSACFVGCANKPLWSEDYVDITYDDNGDPIINFSDNLTYTPYEGEIGFASYSIPSHPDFSIDLDRVIANKCYRSFYLFKVLKRLTTEEAQKLDGYLDQYPYNQSTYYEIALIYDFVENKEVDEIITLRMSRNYYNQLMGRPLYSVGDCWTGIITNEYNDKIFVVSGLCNYIKDTKDIAFDTFVYTWAYDDELECIELELKDDEKIVEGEFKDNPLLIAQKFRLGDVVNFLKNALEERGYEIQQ